MYVHVRTPEEKPDLKGTDPFSLVSGGEVELVHSECVGGSMSLKAEGDSVRLACSKCGAEQGLDRAEAADALQRVIEHDEYAWAGEAGFLPD